MTVVGLGWALLLSGSALSVVASADVAMSARKLVALLLGAVVFYATGRLRARGRCLALLWTLIGATLVVCVIANVQVDRNAWKLDALNRPVYALFAHLPRLGDLAFNQNAIASYLVVVLPLAAGLAASRLAWRVRILAAACGSLLLGELLLTEARAAILSLGLACIVLVLHAKGRARWLALAAPLAAVAALASGLIALPMQLSWLPTAGSSAERVAIWQSALTMIADAPLTGIGLGMFQHTYASYMLPAYYTTQPHAHNLFLQVWAESGVLALAGMALLAGAAVWRASRRAPDPIGAGIAVSTLALLLHSQVDSYFAGDARMYWFLFLPLGLLLGGAGEPPPLPSLRVSGWWAPALALVTLVLAPLAFVNLGTIDRLRGDPSATTWFARAQASPLPGGLAARGLGLQAEAQGQTEPAIQYLDLAVREGAPEPLTRFAMGQVLLRADRVDDAVPVLRAAGAAPWLVRTAEISSSPADAESALDLALQVNPYERNAYQNLARLYLPQARLQEARTALDAELSLPGRPSAGAYLLRGLLAYWLDGDLPGAQGNLISAMRLQPDDPAPCVAWADILADTGARDAAAWHDRARELSAKAVTQDDSLGHAYEALGLWPQAAAEYARIGQADPLGQFDLGQLQLQEGQLTGGIQHIEAAVRAIPNHEAFRLALAHAYTLVGQPDKARAQLQAVAALR
ncbi:MAG: O-antigen ligase family protein [Chloroflexi bacterium]|nr:O-antigen ligase family protein [Chloroflexota bacterium]